MAENLPHSQKKQNQKVFFFITDLEGLNNSLAQSTGEL